MATSAEMDTARRTEAMALEFAKLYGDARAEEATEFVSKAEDTLHLRDASRLGIQGNTVQ